MPLIQESTCIPSAPNVSWINRATTLLSSTCRIEICDVAGFALTFITFSFVFLGWEKRWRRRFRMADLVLSKFLWRGGFYKNGGVVLFLEAERGGCFLVPPGLFITRRVVYPPA